MRQCLQSGFAKLYSSSIVILQVYTAEDMEAKRWSSICMVQYAKLYCKFILQKIWQQNGCAVSVCWDAMGYTEGTVAICKVVRQVCVSNAEVMAAKRLCSICVLGCDGIH